MTELADHSQTLRIKAINVSNWLVGEKNNTPGDFPRKTTLVTFFDENYLGNKEAIHKILDGCDDTGYFKNPNKEKSVIPEFKVNKEDDCSVREILYVENGDWARFEQVDKKGNHERTFFNQYIMSWDEFLIRGRPKEITLDFFRNISPPVDLERRPKP